MAQQDANRVLNRRGARIISAEEAEAVNGANGGPHTNTACTFAIQVVIAGGNGFDGDLGECGIPN